VYEKFRGEQFAMLAIGREHSSAEVLRFKEKHHFSFPMAADPQRAVFAMYAEKSIPRSLVIDGNGQVVFQVIGYSDGEFGRLVAIIRSKLSDLPRQPNRP
jgi:peroxiredoxin